MVTAYPVGAYLDAKGEKQHWAIDNYKLEGIRHTQWITDDVIKYHRSVETYVNTLLDKGFTLVRMLEPEASARRFASAPNCEESRRRSRVYADLGASVATLAALRRAGG